MKNKGLFVWKKEVKLYLYCQNRQSAECQEVVRELKRCKKGQINVQNKEINL